jgi:hypothetical protein
MGKPSKHILEFMETYKVDSDEIWEVHGSTWVVKHKALERVANEIGITFDRPSVIACDIANKSMIVCTFGKLGEKTDWSFGEASPANNKNSYFAAMAEKRSRDRVILKLLNTHGALYSEAEADEFNQRQNPHVTRPADVMPETEYDERGKPVDNIPLPDPASVKKLRVVDQRPIFEAMQTEIHATGSLAELNAWASANKDRLGSLKPDWQEYLRGVFAEHRDAIRNMDAGDEQRMAG